MTPTKLYVSGPMTGIEEMNYTAFALAAIDLRRNGFEVVSPAETTVPDGSTWQEYMRDDVAALVTCDGIATLDGWYASRGATLEVYIGTQLGLVVMSVADWLRSVAR